MPETRKSPEIEAGLIAKSVAVGAALGIESLRHLDQTLRRRGVREGLGSSRACVASDTSVARVCGQTKTAWVRKALRASWRRVRSRGLLGVKVADKKLRVGILDGTTVGGQMASVLVEVGEIPTPLCLGRIVKRGKELPMSLAVLQHVAKAEGRGVLTHTMGDGLYACESFWQTCEGVGTCGIVKTCEAGSLTILQDANQMFDAPTRLPGVEYVEGTDAERGCRYRIWAVADLPWSHTDRLLKVARVEETGLKGPKAGESERFWVISQDQTLDAWMLRTLGHRRWFIENNQFKAFNEQAHSKHVFSRDPHTALVISALQMIGTLWIMGYHHFLAQFRDQMKSLWDHGTFPMKGLRDLLWTSLPLVEADTT